MTKRDTREFLREDGEKKLNDFISFASTAASFRVVSEGLGNLVEGTGAMVNEVNMSRLLSEKFYNMMAYSSPEAFQDWLKTRQAVSSQSYATALSRVQGDYGEVELLRELQGQVKSILNKATFPVNEAGRVASNTPGIDIEVRNRFTNKIVERIQVKTVSNENSIDEIIEGLRNNKHFLPSDTLAGPKELLEAAKEAGFTNKMIDTGSVKDMKALRKKLEERILNGEIRTNYTPSEVIKKMGEGAIIGCAIRVSLSGLMNYMKYRRGDISAKEAITEISEDGIKGTVSGAALAGASIILPAGALGFAGGIAIGMYLEAALTNVLDEVFGKGAYHEILVASGYVMGTSQNLLDAIEEFKRDRESVQVSGQQVSENQRRSAEVQKEFDRIMNGGKPRLRNGGRQMNDNTTMQINREIFDSSKDPAVLLEAARDVLQASETDFAHMKNKTWYKRLWEIVTFSKDNEKLLAKGVSSLAKLQDIVLNMVMDLSRENADIAKWVSVNSREITQLYNNDIRLAQELYKVKRKLSKLSDGYYQRPRLEACTSEARVIIISALRKFISENESNDYTKRFLKKLYNAIGERDDYAASQFNYKDTEDLDINEQELLCVMLYQLAALMDISFDADEIDKPTEFLNISHAMRKKIKNSINESLFIDDKDYIADYYEYILDTLDSEGIIFVEEEAAPLLPDDEEKEGEAPYIEDDKIEMEDYVLTSILHILPGETFALMGKRVHLKAFINCEGNLEFDHCVIYYNESEASDEITLGRGATLTITNSVVINKGLDETPFISGKFNAARIESSTFIDCSFFLELSDCFSFLFSRCKLVDCCAPFLSIYMTNNAVAEISSNIITENDLAEFHRSGICAFGAKCFYLKNGKRLFQNNLIIESEGFHHRGKMEYLDGVETYVKNCTIIGAVQGIEAQHITACVFKKSESIVAKFDSESNKEAVVDNCLFEECTDVLLLNGDATISHCQFLFCYDKIITPWGFSYPAATVKYCHFVNTKNTMHWSDFFGTGFINIPCIHFRNPSEIKKPKGHTYRLENRIENCIFDGIDIDNGFLIAADDVGKKPDSHVAYINSCDFRNCSTKRSSNKIIKEYVTYNNALKKERSFHAILTSNCRGLDRINEGASRTDNYERKTVDSSGARIGSDIIVDDEGNAFTQSQMIGAPTALRAYEEKRYRMLEIPVD